MKTILKKVSAVIAALAIMVTAVVFDVPEKITAEAAEEHTHKVCINADVCPDCESGGEHEEITWQPWSKTNSLPTEEGNYYLCNYVYLSGVATIDANIKICLNGNRIKQNKTNAQILDVSGNGSLTLCDCKSGGKLCGGSFDDGNGGAIYVSGILTIYSGEIRENTAMANGTIFVKNTGKLTMNGGKISNNLVNSGGGVYNEGIFTMNGGTISYNKTNSSGSGGGVDNRGEFEMNGGMISNNTARLNAGGVNNLSTFTMNGGTISNNTAGNNAEGFGGGVYAHTDSVFKINGEITISGNKKSTSTNSNVYLASGAVINIGEKFAPISTIPVSSQGRISNCNSMPIDVTNTTNFDISSRFRSEMGDNTQIVYNDSKVQIQGKHTLTGKQHITATCTTPGGYVGRCTVCTKTDMFNFETAAIGHKWGSTLEIKTAPTIFTTGTAELICENDRSHKDLTTVPKLSDEDVWSKDTENSTEPTINADGSYTYTSDYGTITVTVPKLSDEDVWSKDPENSTEPTINTDGSYTYTSDYGTVTVDVPKLSDEDVWSKDPENSTEPAINADGSYTYTGDYGTVTVTVPKLSDPEVWTKDPESSITPTESQPGKDVYTSDYGVVEVALPELDHTHILTYVPEVPATETKEGTKEHWHCGGCDKDFADKDGEVEVTESDLIIPIIIAEVTVGENAPQVTTDQDELIEAVDIGDVEDSSEIKITLIVEDASETVTESDKLAAEEALTELDGFQMGQFIDISLIMETITGSETTATAITETKKPLTITLTIPSDLLGKAEYSVIRVHEGEITVLEDMDDDPATITIQTDKFSTYALAYIEKANDDTPPDENNSGSSDTTPGESEPSDSEATPSGNGGTSDSDTASPSDDNSSNNESGDNSDNSNTSDDNNNYKPTENTPNDNNHGNPSTGVAVSLLPLAAAVIVLTVTAKRKKK